MSSRAAMLDTTLCRVLLVCFSLTIQSCCCKYAQSVVRGSIGLCICCDASCLGRSHSFCHRSCTSLCGQCRDLRPSGFARKKQKAAALTGAVLSALQCSRDSLTQVQSITCGQVSRGSFAICRRGPLALCATCRFGTSGACTCVGGGASCPVFQEVKRFLMQRCTCVGSLLEAKCSNEDNLLKNLRSLSTCSWVSGAWQ